MENALVHIGLFKSGSTYMQELWLNADSVNLFYREMVPILEAAQSIARNRPPETANLALEVDETGFNIFSHEGLSSAFGGEKPDQALVAQYQDIAAEVIRSLLGPTKVLIVSREPVGWILSVYNQLVKQGASFTFPQFLNTERAYMEQALDLAQLVKVWEKHHGAGSVLVLPFELLCDDPGGFFGAVSEHCGAPAPDPATASEQSTNPSLRPVELNIMRDLNRWTEIFIDKGLANIDVEGVDFKSILSSARVGLRYALQVSPADLQPYLQVLNRHCKDCQVDRDLIDAAWLQGIRDRLSAFLDGADFFGYREIYTGAATR